MENVICKAEIKRYNNLPFKIWYIIAIIAIIIGAIPTKDATYYGVPCWEFHWLIILVATYNKYSGFEIYSYSSIFKLILITIAIFVFPLIIKRTLRKIEQNSSLELTDNGIRGQRKKLFSTANLQLPIDKIDSVMVSENFFDKFNGGKTVAIRSASGLIKFPWVQNADEFVNTTLAKIEEYKQTMKQDNQSLISAFAQNHPNNTVEASIATKLKELKELLDNGIISQEEFDMKKQDLLSKI